MFCPNCGKPVVSSRCSECGTPLGTSVFLRPYIPSTPQERGQLFKLIFEFAILAPTLAILMFMVGGALLFGLLWVLIRHFLL